MICINTEKMVTIIITVMRCYRLTIGSRRICSDKGVVMNDSKSNGCVDDMIWYISFKSFHPLLKQNLCFFPFGERGGDSVSFSNLLKLKYVYQIIFCLENSTERGNNNTIHKPALNYSIFLAFSEAF